MAKLLYNARNNSRFRFLWNVLDTSFDVDVKDANKMTLEEIDSYDLIFNERHDSRINSSHWLNLINPNKILNGTVVGTRKTYTGEVFTKHFGVPLNIYHGDVSYNKPNGIFIKEEGQTTGRYIVADKPKWEKNWVNQINYANDDGIYGIYFCCGELLYSYNYKSKDNKSVKYHNAVSKEYFDNKTTHKMFGKYVDKLMAMATEMGLDYGRFDTIIDPEKGLIVIDLNNAPFGKQVFNREFRELPIYQESIGNVSRMITNKLSSL